MKSRTGTGPKVKFGIEASGGQMSENTHSGEVIDKLMCKNV